MKILYRLPGMGWDKNRYVTLDELFISNIFDYNTTVVGNQRDYDYLKGMELVRGETLGDLALDPTFTVHTFNVTEIMLLWT